MIKPIAIDARCRANATGFRLEKGKTYYYVAKGSWKDKDRECDADGYEEEKLNRFRFLRRVRDARWFQLIGKVNGEVVVLGKQGSFGAPESGELICFANDAPLMRWNNSGTLLLTVSETPL